MSDSQFGQFRRIITSHQPDDTDGSSVQIHDDQVTLTPVLDGMAHILPLFASKGLPSTSAHSLTADDITDAMNMAPNVVMEGGVNCRITDVKPNYLIKMHRTNSIDYNIIMAGSVTLITPIRHADGTEGEQRTAVKAGEIVCQRGTIHAWESGPEGARWITVVVPAKPVEKDGKTFAEVDFQ